MAGNCRSLSWCSIHSWDVSEGIATLKLLMNILSCFRFLDSSAMVWISSVPTRTDGGGWFPLQHCFEMMGHHLYLGHVSITMEGINDHLMAIGLFLWDQVSMKASCYKSRRPPRIWPFVCFFSSLFFCHVGIQLGPLTHSSTFLSGSSSCQNHEPNNTPFFIHNSALDILLEQHKVVWNRFVINSTAKNILVNVFW